ncbi:hypothetical protein niasHT_021157 [Heterodera trifolii]|uniref:Amino acid transporter transmembrane domain-containing protein n=1 Tax=Heterodera trifolii TaxID=157864 RepID=A0ABD2JFI2_9BILA
MTSSIRSYSDKVSAAEQSQSQKNFGDGETTPPEEEAHNEQKDDQQEEGEGAAILPNDADGEIIRKEGIPFPLILLNFIKGLIGAGILGLPLASKDAGPLYKMISLFCIAIISFYSMSILVKGAQYHYTRLKISFLTFGDLAEESCKVSFGWIKNYGPLAKNIVNIITIVHQFGFCSMYYLFIASTFQTLAVSFQTVIGEGKADNEPKGKEPFWFLFIFFPIVALNSIVSMRILSIMCLIGNVLMITSLTLILFMLSKIVFTERAHPIPFALPSADGFFKACGTIIVSCLAQPLVLPLENKIKKPSQMLGPFGVLSIGIAISTIVYAIVGFLGYSAYGEEIQSTVLEHLECVNDKKKLAPLTYIIRIARCMSTTASFMLQLFVIVGVLWPLLEKRIEKLSRIWKIGIEFIFRAILVSVCLAISYSINNLAAIIRLIGVTTGTLLAFVLPPIFDLLTFVPLFRSQNRLREANVRLGINICIIVFGFVILVGGLVVNVITMASKEEDWKCGVNATTSGSVTATMQLYTTPI